MSINSANFNIIDIPFKIFDVLEYRFVKNGINKIKTAVHLQNPRDVGETKLTAPLATIKLLAIKIGWIRSRR